MTESTILTRQRDHIFEVILNRPDKRNAMNVQMMTELGQAFDEAEHAFQNGARVIFVRSESRVFSSGIDLAELAQLGSAYGDNWRDNLFPTTANYQNIFNKIENCSLPTICIMHGYALGLSFEMALACDFRIVADRTKLGLPETRLGIIPDVGGTVRLTKLIGPARAKEVIMTGRNISTEEAERWGMVNTVVPKDELLSCAESLADEIAQSAPLAVSYTKRVVNNIMDYQAGLNLEAWAQAQLFRTDDFENAVKAMLDKSYPIDWESK